MNSVYYHIGQSKSSKSVVRVFEQCVNEKTVEAVRVDCVSVVWTVFVFLLDIVWTLSHT